MATNMALRLNNRFSLREFLGVSWAGWLLGCAWVAIANSIPNTDEAWEAKNVEPDGDQGRMLPEQVAILSRHSMAEIAEAARVAYHYGGDDLVCHLGRGGPGNRVIADVLDCTYRLNTLDPKCQGPAIGETRIPSLVHDYCVAEGFAATAHMAVAVTWAG